MSTSPAPAWSMTVGPSHLLMGAGTHRAAGGHRHRHEAAGGHRVLVKVGEAGTRCVPAPGAVARGHHR